MVDGRRPVLATLHGPRWSARTACRTSASRTSRTGDIAPRRVSRSGLRGLSAATTSSSTRRRCATTTSRSRSPSPSTTTTSRRRKSTLLKRTEVLGGYDPSQLPGGAALRDGARRHEGPDLARLPEGPAAERQEPRPPLRLRLVRRPRCRRPSARTASACSTAASSSPIAHIRGGGEMGKKWHDQGQMLTKKNTFTDFIACAETPDRRQGTPRKDRLVIEGGSAGGLLMGAVTNMRPDLFKAVVTHVPVRRRDQHDARRVAAADGRRVRGVGQPAGSPSSTTT